jgi:hypothetical protein
LAVPIDKEGDRKMRIRCLLTGVIVLMVCLLSLDLAVGDEIEDLIRGGDFEEGIADKNLWTLQIEGQAGCILTIDKKESVSGKASLFAEVTSIDNAAPWVPWIWQTHTIKKGETYTLSMFLKAEEERNVVLNVRDLNAPKQEHFEKTVLVGTEWQEYWATFTSPKDVAAKVGLRGGPAINYWVDVIKFYEGEYVPTEIDGQRIAVFPRSRLATTWATLKARPGLRNATVGSHSPR